LAATGVVLGAIYMLHMAARVIWGPLKVPGHHEAGDTSAPGHEHPHEDTHHAGQSHNDIGGREIAILVPIAVVVIILGVAPSGFMKSILAPVQNLRQPVAVAQKQQPAGVEAVAQAVPQTVAVVKE
jgi:NADH-quinone oxidoreductase subunit M